MIQSEWSSKDVRKYLNFCFGVANNEITCFSILNLFWIMSDIPNDLIVFPDIEEHSVDAEKDNVLQEFDPLFHLSEKEPKPSVSSCKSPRIPDYNIQNLRTYHINEWASMNSNVRLGRLFNKDAIWDELLEIASIQKEGTGNTLTHANTSPNLSSLSSQQNTTVKVEVLALL